MARGDFHCSLAYELTWCVKNDSSSSSSQKDLSFQDSSVSGLYCCPWWEIKKSGWLVHHFTEHLWCNKPPKRIGQELHVTRSYIKSPADFNAVIITYWQKSNRPLSCCNGFSFLMQQWFIWLKSSSDLGELWGDVHLKLSCVHLIFMYFCKLCKNWTQTRNS